MTPDIFSTEMLRPREQLEAWREWYRSVFEVVPKYPTADGFSGETRLWNLGGLLVSRTIAPPARVVRTRPHLERDPADHWVISYCVRGAFFAKTADTEAEVPAKVPFLWSLRQELFYERTHADWIQFFLARDTFRDIAPLLDAVCGSPLDTPLGHLLGDYMMALERRLPEVTDSDLSGIARALGTMVAAGAAPSTQRTVIAKPQIALGRKERVRQAVRRHLRTPTLGPKTLSRIVGMSRSNLYRLFEDAGGVARYIQRERLLEAHSILSRPEKTQSISAIAEDLCFADASSFSRMFKREFGYSPGELRSGALAGLALSAAPRSQAPSSLVNLGKLLRAI